MVNTRHDGHKSRPSQADRKVAAELMEQARREAATAKAAKAKGTSTLRKVQRKAGTGAAAVIPSTLAPEPVTTPINERKHAAFRRLAPPRMTNLLHYFRANILVLAAAERYDYTLDEAQAMIDAVEGMGRELRHAFQQRGKRRLRGEFSF